MGIRLESSQEDRLVSRQTGDYCLLRSTITLFIRTLGYVEQEGQAVLPRAADSRAGFEE